MACRSLAKTHSVLQQANSGGRDRGIQVYSIDFNDLRMQQTPQYPVSTYMRGHAHRMATQVVTPCMYPYATGHLSGRILHRHTGPSSRGNISTGISGFSRGDTCLGKTVQALKRGQDYSKQNNAR